MHRSLRPRLATRQALSRSYGLFFAEFLNEGSPVHLSTIVPTHRCRFAVRIPAAHVHCLFWTPLSPPSDQSCDVTCAQRETPGRCIAETPGDYDDAQQWKHRRKGRNVDLLSIGYPPLPRGLTLGPPHPGTICVAQETLGLRWERFSLSVMLLMPAFSLPCAPPALAGPASLHRERSPTTTSRNAT